MCMCVWIRTCAYMQLRAPWPGNPQGSWCARVIEINSNYKQFHQNHWNSLGNVDFSGLSSLDAAQQARWSEDQAMRAPSIPFRVWGGWVGLCIQHSAKPNSRAPSSRASSPRATGSGAPSFRAPKFQSSEVPALRVAAPKLQRSNFQIHSFGAWSF